MSTYIERLKIEREHLDKKIELIQAFIESSPLFEKLDFIDKELMTFQEEFMVSYSDILSKRISRELVKIKK